MNKDAMKPANLRANAMPVDGFVMTVDGKLKMRFESADDAAAAGAELKRRYPAIQVAVYDALARIYTPIDVPELVQ